MRPSFQKWIIDPSVSWIPKKRWIPIFITLIALFSGIGATLGIALQLTNVAIFLLLLSGVCDIIDGTLARRDSLSTPIGAVFDIFVDRTVEFAVILGLFLVDPVNRALFSLLMLGSMLLCVTSFLVVGIFQENASEKSFHYSPGLVERAEAFIFFTAMILFPGQFSWLAIVFVGLVLLTTFLRLIQFFLHSKRGKADKEHQGKPL